MKIRKIWGAGGTGKSHSLAKYLVEKEKEDPTFSFLILSYTHVGKNEIYKKYLQLKGIDISDFNPFKNYSECKTFHSLVYNILSRQVKEEMTKKVKITDYLLKRNLEFEIIEELKEVASKLFLRDFDDKLKAFEVNFEELSKKILDLNPNRKRKLYELYTYLNELNENEEFNLIDKLVKELKSLKVDELVLLMLLSEGNLYDTGYIINPFKQEKVDNKLNFVLKKYEAIFKVNPEDRIKEVLDAVFDEDYASPLHPIYNMRKFYETLKEKGFKDDFGYYNTIVLDEAQDTPEVLLNFLLDFYDAEELIMAGDPYQAIFLDLGYNSQFVKKDSKTEIMKTLWRYNKEYLENIKKFFYYPVYTIDLINDFKGNNKTKFRILEVEIVSEKDPYLKAGIEVMKVIKNNPNKLFLTHNIRKFKLKVKNFIFLPYKEFLKDKISLVTNYMTLLALAQKFDEKNKRKAEVLYNTLVEYYNYYPLPKYLKLFPKEEKEKTFWSSFNINKEFLKFEELLSNKKVSEEVYSILRKKYYLESGEIKDFIIYITTHRSKGKTLEEEVYYLPTKGLYYYLEKEYRDYLFIHFLLKYVSLTRPSKELIYVMPKSLL